MFIIDDLLFWLPARGLIKVLEKVEEQAAGEHKKELKSELLEAIEDLRNGRINKKEYQKIEKEILEKLKRYRH